VDLSTITNDLQTLNQDAQDLASKQQAKQQAAAAVVAAQQADSQAAAAVGTSSTRYQTDKKALHDAIDAAFPDVGTAAAVAPASPAPAPVG